MASAPALTKSCGFGRSDSGSPALEQVVWHLCQVREV